MTDARTPKSKRRYGATCRGSGPRGKGAVSEWPKLLQVSEEIREWSAMLERELGNWPDVTSRPMFGLIGFYRDDVIFACLPRTRALSSPNSIIFKFNRMPPKLLKHAKKDRRIGSEREGPGARWYSFELNSTDDLSDALWWLSQAYEEAS